MVTTITEIQQTAKSWADELGAGKEGCRKTLRKFGKSSTRSFEETQKFKYV